MKRKILLIDDSLTVQKVFSLTFDKQKFQLHFAKTKEEAAKIIREQQPEFILVSENLKDLSAPSFPREVEVWLGRNGKMPVMILISTQGHFVDAKLCRRSPQTFYSANASGPR